MHFGKRRLKSYLVSSLDYSFGKLGILEFCGKTRLTFGTKAQWKHLAVLEAKYIASNQNVLCRQEGSLICCTSFHLRGAWSDRDTNGIFAHCSLIFYFIDFKFSKFVCPSELHPLMWFFLKNSFRKKKNIRKTTQNALAPSIFIVLSIVLKLGTPLLPIQAQNTLLQNFSFRSRSRDMDEKPPKTLFYPTRSALTKHNFFRRSKLKNL